MESLKKSRILLLAVVIALLWMYLIGQTVRMRARLRVAESAMSSQRHGVIGNEARLQHGELEHLIIVCGHSVFRGTDLATAMDTPAAWTLQPYQKGQLPFILTHVRDGVALAANNSKAALVFSGGQTSKDAGPISEAQSYWLVARAAGWFGLGASGIEDRSFTEQFARDSFENLFFSICRFREIAGHYPLRITLVSFSFKQTRFTDLHLRALRFPQSCFAFHGTAAEAKGDVDASTREAFAADPYGCKESDGALGVLADKKFSRNPFLNHMPYPTGCPELSELFDYCSPSLFAGPLPWDGRSCV